MDGIVNKSFEVATSLFATLVKPGTASVTAVDGAPEFAPGQTGRRSPRKTGRRPPPKAGQRTPAAVDRPVRADAGRPALSLGTAAAAPGTLGAMRVAPGATSRACDVPGSWRRTGGGPSDRRIGSAGTGKVGTGRVGTSRAGTGRVGTSRVGTSRAGASRVRGFCVGGSDPSKRRRRLPRRVRSQGHRPGRCMSQRSSLFPQSPVGRLPIGSKHRIISFLSSLTCRSGARAAIPAWINAVTT